MFNLGVAFLKSVSICNRNCKLLTSNPKINRVQHIRLLSFDHETSLLLIQNEQMSSTCAITFLSIGKLPPGCLPVNCEVR